MWRNVEVRIGGKDYVFEAKVFDRGSMFGIEDGRVSKLSIYDKKTGDELYCYERGWGSEKAPKEFIDKALELWPEN